MVVVVMMVVVCVHVCVCMHACCASMSVCMCVFVCLCLLMYVYIHVCVLLWKVAYVYVWALYVHVCVCVCAHVRAGVHACVHMHMHACLVVQGFFSVFVLFCFLTKGITCFLLFTALVSFSMHYTLHIYCVLFTQTHTESLWCDFKNKDFTIQCLYLLLYLLFMILVKFHWTHQQTAVERCSMHLGRHPVGENSDSDVALCYSQRRQPWRSSSWTVSWMIVCVPCHGCLCQQIHLNLLTLPGRQWEVTDKPLQFQQTPTFDIALPLQPFSIRFFNCRGREEGSGETKELGGRVRSKCKGLTGTKLKALNIK